MRVPRWARNWFLDGWPRLLTIGSVLGSVFLLLIIIGHLTSGSHAHPTPKVVRTTVRTAAAPTTSTSPTIPAATTSTTVPATTTTSTSTTTLPPRQSLPAAAGRAATTFVDTWADRNLPTAVWHRRIAALVTTAEQPGFAAADYPAAVPAGVRAVGAPIGSGDSGGAEVQVLTTKFPADMILAVVDGRYLVASFET